jgi:hypothetical protein
MKLKEAIEQLDHSVDAHWTEDGMPSVDAVSAIIGREVTREQITKAAPDLVRTKEDAVVTDQGDDEEQGETQEQLPQGDEARSAVTAYDDELSDLDAQMEELRKRREAKQAERDRLVTETDAGANTPFHQLLGDYFSSQDQVRKEHAERLAAANALLGKQVASGTGASQLDQSMTAQRGHGQKRPSFTAPPPAQKTEG